MKYILLILLTLSSLSAKKNMNYAKNEMHTLTPKQGSFELELNMLMMNDVVDILDLKGKEFGDNPDFDAIGDLKGYDLALRYAILDDLMVSARYSIEEIQYSSDWIQNNKLDIYLRYNVFQNGISFLNSGITIDAGYVSNKLKDFYINDINTIQKTLQSVFPNDTTSINTIGELFYIDPDKGPIVLIDPYVALKDTKDESYYLRFLTGFYSKNSYTDFYTGVKITQIKNTIASTEQMATYAATKNESIPIILDRDETTIFAGFSYTFDTEPFIYEFNYQFEHYIRDEGLDYVNYNHIIDAAISYPVGKNLLLTAGAKIMYRQLNGQIPYLYNKYTQTSYDHKYGYASFGMIYIFR